MSPKLVLSSHHSDAVLTQTQWSLSDAVLHPFTATGLHSPQPSSRLYSQTSGRALTVKRSLEYHLIHKSNERTNSENLCDSIFPFHLPAGSNSIRFSFIDSLTYVRSPIAVFGISLSLIIHASIIYLSFQVHIEPRRIFQFNIIIMNRKSNSFLL